MKPLRKFKYFSATEDWKLIDQVNTWIEETRARIVNYTLTSDAFGKKMIVFYENEEN